MMKLMMDVFKFKMSAKPSGTRHDETIRVLVRVRPAPALGVPFDMVDRSPDGALAAFAAAQREREEEERRRRDDERGERGGA